MKRSKQPINPTTMSFVLLAFGTTIGFSGCIPQASDAEIEQMCTHLTVLRKKPDDKEMLKQCIQEARKEGVSQKRALCRISAINKLEYWNRCRTGEARTNNNKSDE